VNKKIGDLDLAAQIGVDIIAIRRVKKWIIDPKDDEVIRENDVLIARGAPMGIEKLRAMAEGREVVIEE
ncbi:hypothetical protein DRO58_07375, partial [Candidatus Bathyarchaeota archaeon]